MAWGVHMIEECFECGTNVDVWGEPEPEEVVCDFCQLPEEKRDKIYEEIHRLWLNEEGLEG
jgi:hypothetical protein